MNVFLFFSKGDFGRRKNFSTLEEKELLPSSKFFCAFAFVPSLFPVMKFCFLLGKKTSRREKKTLVFPTQSPLVSVVLGKRKSCEQFRLRQFIYLILSISPKRNILAHSPYFKVRESNLDFLLLDTKTGLLRNPLFPSLPPPPSPSYDQYAVERRNPILSPSDLPRDEKRKDESLFYSLIKGEIWLIQS